MHIDSMRISQACYLLEEVQQAHDIKQDDKHLEGSSQGPGNGMSQNLPTSTDNELQTQGCTNFPKL